MKRLALLFFLLTTILYANETPIRKLVSITYRSQAGTTVALIQLDDDSVWKWTPDMYSENLLRKWNVEDEIIIRTVNHPGFALQNLSQPLYNPIVALSFNSYLIYPCIKNYFEGDDIIELTDGSKYQLIYEFNKRTLYHWSLGDRVIPVRGVNGNIEIINLDIPHENRSQIERSIQVTSLIE